jgi:hypothetical protein
MEMDIKLREKFLTNTDDTGRFIVKSTRTGKTYAVEPIVGKHTPVWGDMDPATKQLSGQYGKKYKGGIEAKESLITDDNGFNNITLLTPGTSPLAYIDILDEKYPDLIPQ